MYQAWTLKIKMINPVSSIGAVVGRVETKLENPQFLTSVICVRIGLKTRMERLGFYVSVCFVSRMLNPTRMFKLSL